MYILTRKIFEVRFFFFEINNFLLLDKQKINMFNYMIHDKILHDGSKYFFVILY